jgi:hypothetical protein
MKRINKFFTSVFFLTLFSAITVVAQDETSSCRVLLPQIAGIYEGECKKGLADGMGKAQGIDLYEGCFRKGYPEGHGKYTWKDGATFEGEWKKGKKNGYGVLTNHPASQDSILTGYWIDDEYIGTEKSPFKVNNKGINVLGLNVTRVGSDKDQIVVEFNKNGKPLSIYSFSVTEVLGGYSTISKSDFSKTLLNVRFPFRAEMAGGAYVFDVTISQRGSWKIIVNVTDK